MKILSPLENSAKFYLNWVQVRPKITQKFGVDFKKNGKLFYKNLGLKGHNGLDFRAKVGTPVFASIEGIVKIGDEKKSGYGKFVKIRNSEKKIEIVVAHLSKISVKNNSKIETGDQLGLTGNSGGSTGPHLHFGLRFLMENGDDVFNWPVLNYKNGFWGYLDPTKFLLTWKGDLEKTSLAD
jgi:murein DD-endopeptidase MepM/ murein hydrolase activator NlpD